MQEEVTQKTIALVIKTAKLDANVLKAAMKMYPNLPKLLYIGSKPIPQTAYKINDCGSFFFTNICINDII